MHPTLMEETDAEPSPTANGVTWHKPVHAIRHLTFATMAIIALAATLVVPASTSTGASAPGDDLFLGSGTSQSASSTTTRP